MSPFIRAVLARSLAEHEARILETPRPKTLPDAPEPRVKGRCACGEVALLGRDECRACRQSAEVKPGRKWCLADVVAVVRRMGTATADDVMERLECGRDNANAALSRAVKRGWLKRVRFGEYEVTP